MTEVLLKLKDGNGNLKGIATSEYNYLAYQTGLHLASASLTDPGSLNITDTGGTTVGTFTNTVFNQAIGTHPGTSITTSSTSVTLYQSTGTADESGANFARPVVLIDDTDTINPQDIKAVNDTRLNSLVDYLIELVYSLDYPGAYRLATSTPGANWTAEISNIFTDTRTDGTTVNYTLWKRRALTAPTAVKPLALKYSGATYEGMMEMSDAEIQYTFGQRAKTRITASGIGTYKLLASGDSLPAGTWVTKGSAVDTKQQTADADYTRTSTRNSTRNSQRTSTRVDFINYIGNYLSNFTRDSTVNYTRISAGTYAGAAYTRTSTRDSNQSYYTRNSTVNFEGAVYSRVSTRNSDGGAYTRDSIVNFEGAVYTRTSNVNYIGNFLGQTNFQRISTRTSVETYNGFTGYYTGNYVGDFAHGTYYTRTSTVYYNGIVAQDFTGNYLGDVTYLGDYVRGFTGNYDRLFVGNFVGNYVRTYEGNFTGNYEKSFIGDFVGNYLRTYTGNFTGNYERDFVGNYTGDFVGNFIGNYENDFLGDYVAGYEGNFLGDYVGDFIGNYTGNFLGETIQPSSSTIETYTLYVRTA